MSQRPPLRAERLRCAPPVRHGRSAPRPPMVAAHAAPRRASSADALLFACRPPLSHMQRVLPPRFPSQCSPRHVHKRFTIKHAATTRVMSSALCPRHAAHGRGRNKWPNVTAKNNKSAQTIDCRPDQNPKKKNKNHTNIDEDLILKDYPHPISSHRESQRS